MILDEKRCRRVIGELPRRKYTTNKIINRERLTMDDTFYLTMVVLSFLPLCKCGVTARLLVGDIFGIEKPNPRIEALIVRYARRISEVFKRVTGWRANLQGLSNPCDFAVRIVREL